MQVLSQRLWQATHNYDIDTPVTAQTYCLDLEVLEYFQTEQVKVALRVFLFGRVVPLHLELVAVAGPTESFATTMSWKRIGRRMNRYELWETTELSAQKASKWFALIWSDQSWTWSIISWVDLDCLYALRILAVRLATRTAHRRSFHHMQCFIKDRQFNARSNENYASRRNKLMSLEQSLSLLGKRDAVESRTSDISNITHH